jgi:arylsulfatase A-like enzyme
MDSRPRRAATLWAVLSSSLAAAGLNLGASLIAHPRALASFEQLGLPLAAGWVGLLAAALLLVGGLGAAGRAAGLTAGPLDAALVVGFVLTAALAPLVEVGLRAASSERAAVVLVCAAGFVLCAASSAYAFAIRFGARVSARAALVFPPLAALVLLVTLWLGEYQAAGAARAGAWLAGAGALAAGAWAARRLAPGLALPLGAALVLLHGAFDALHAPAGANRTRPPASDRPPVVLITVDTLRTDRVLGTSPARVATPAIDALAADSVVFTQARSAAPWTKPALATLLTGLSPLVHGMTNRRARLPEEAETLAERLRAAGYRTGGVGLNVHLERAFRFDQGFDAYAFPARLDYGISLGARALARLAPTRFPAVFPSTTAIAEEAEAWIRAHADEPFFLWLHVLDPHWPYEPPEEWLEHPERHPRRWGEPDMVTAVQAGNTKPGAAERERVAELYAGEIRYVDAELARVLGALRELGLYERALIVLASDHGEEFWEHGRYEHGHTLYDEVLRVPLAFKLPGTPVRATVDAAVSTEALVPTVLDALGLAYDPTQLGAGSLAPWWRTPDAAVVEPQFACGTYYFGEKRAVVFDGWKLVLELDTGRSELFDLGDPRELHSLAAARPEQLERGLALVREWEERCAALRERLGIQFDSAEASQAVLDTLEALGYAGNE